MAEVVLGLDVGQARIGLARGEIGSGFAFGRGFITRSSLQADIAALKAVAEQENTSTLVIGLPTRSDGGDSKQTQRVRQLAHDLKTAGFTVILEDERFTTQLASHQMTQAPLSKKKRQVKGRLDEASAVLILESYLRKQR